MANNRDTNRDHAARVGTDNFDRITGDLGLNKKVQDEDQIQDSNMSENNKAKDVGVMNAPGRESKDYGQQQRPDINKTPLV